MVFYLYMAFRIRSSNKQLTTDIVGIPINTSVSHPSIDNFLVYKGTDWTLAKTDSIKGNTGPIGATGPTGRDGLNSGYPVYPLFKI